LFCDEIEMRQLSQCATITEPLFFKLKDESSLYHKKNIKTVKTVPQ